MEIWRVIFVVKNQFLVHLFCFIIRAAPEKDASIKSQDGQYPSETSTKPFQIKYSFLTKLVLIDEKEKIIFARYNSYIMVPWFIVCDILKELDEGKIKILVNFIPNFYEK